MSFISSLCLLDRHRLFTHDNQQPSHPKVGTQLRLHGEYASTVSPVVCAGFLCVFFFFLTGKCTDCLRFFLCSFFTDNNNDFS